MVEQDEGEKKDAIVGKGKKIVICRKVSYFLKRCETHIHILLIFSPLSLSIAVLKAIEQDSPAVPTLLTDYILKGEMIHS